MTPRQVIKESYAAKIINSGDVWIQMLDHRNLLPHTYDSSVFEAAIEAIEQFYLPALGGLYEQLKKEI